MSVVFPLLEYMIWGTEKLFDMQPEYYKVFIVLMFFMKKEVVNALFPLLRSGVLLQTWTAILFMIATFKIK